MRDNQKPSYNPPNTIGEGVMSIEEFHPYENEEVKLIFGGKYGVTNLGRVISYCNKKPIVLKLSINRHGYNTIGLYIEKGKRPKTFYVHRLVAEAFLGEIPEGMEVNHKDGNKLNNAVTNLEIVTPSENQRHAHAIGLKINPCGELNGMCKLSTEDVLDIIAHIQNGLRNVDIAKIYNIDPKHVSLIRHKKRWKHLWRIVEGSTATETTSS
jgi:hypothetical protein